MVDIIFSAAVQVLSWPTIAYLFGGIAIGFAVGLLPGLGGGGVAALVVSLLVHHRGLDSGRTSDGHAW